MDLTSDEIQLLGIIVNSIIASAAIGTLIYQRIFNTKTLDYNLHPVFQVTDFCPECTKYWTPKLCESANPRSKHFCTEDHWFNITNLSHGPAFQFKCYLIHNLEITSDYKIDKYTDRIIEREALVNKGTVQYKIPIDAIPFKFYNKSATDDFFIIIEYRTVNLKTKFRQVISLHYNPEANVSQINDWKNAISISLPEVCSLKKVKWWQSKSKTLVKELMKVKS